MPRKRTDKLPLVLTGERSDDHFLAHVNRTAIELTYTELATLLSLIAARAVSSHTGYAQTPPVAISRLRKKLGRTLIQTGCKEEYRLAIPPHRVGLEPSFKELASFRIISEEEWKRLWSSCRRL